LENRSQRKTNSMQVCIYFCHKTLKLLNILSIFKMSTLSYSGIEFSVDDLCGRAI
jgi:hypothetical protein